MEKPTEHLAAGTLALGAKLVTAFPLLVLQQLALLVTLFAVGVGLVLLRQAFFYSAPWILVHSQLVALLVNGVVDFAEIAVDAFGVVWDGFADVINAVSSVIPGDGLDVPRLHVLFKNPLSSAVSAADIRRGIVYAQTTCAPYDNVYAVGGDALKLAVGEDACALARFLYPVAWLRPALALLGGLYFGGADPNGDNCRDVDGHPKELSAVCCGLGAGYVILEALLPGFLALLLLISVGGAIARTAGEALVAIAAVGRRGTLLAFDILDRLGV